MLSLALVLINIFLVFNCEKNLIKKIKKLGISPYNISREYVNCMRFDICNFLPREL
jgi:hypothetical protein